MLKETILMCVVLAAPLAVYGAPLPDGCGSPSIQFNVKQAKSKSPVAAAAADSAQIVFVQSLDGVFAGKPLTRFAVDGAWVGAAKGDSYFAVTVPAGAHKICAARQSGAQLERDNVGGAMKTLVAGRTYYFEFKVRRAEVGDLGSHPAGHVLGYSGQDMTAKARDTIDTAQFSEVKELTASELAAKEVSTGTPK